LQQSAGRSESFGVLDAGCGRKQWLQGLPSVLDIEAKHRESSGSVSKKLQTKLLTSSERRQILPLLRCTQRFAANNDSDRRVQRSRCALSSLKIYSRAQPVNIPAPDWVKPLVTQREKRTSH
jgi:hypothetical protein